MCVDKLGRWLFQFGSTGDWFSRPPQCFYIGWLVVVATVGSGVAFSVGTDVSCKPVGAVVRGDLHDSGGAAWLAIRSCEDGYAAW